MGAINPTKLTDWLCRREPVSKWFHECRTGKLRRRESEGGFGRRGSSSGRGFHFKLQQMLTVTSLGWAARSLESLEWAGRRKKKVEGQEVLLRWSHFFPKQNVSQGRFCVCSLHGLRVQSAFSVCLQRDLQDHCMALHMLKTHRTHTHTPSGDNFCHWHMLTLCPLPESHFHSLSHDPSLSSQFEWMNEECSFSL